MSGHFEDSEPVLMNDEILRKAIDEQTSQDQTERTAKAGGLPFNEVYKIRLEYKSKRRNFCPWFTQLIWLLNYLLVYKCKNASARRHSYD